MLEFINKCVICIDLAGLSTNPKGLAGLKGKTVFTVLLHTDEVLEKMVENHPILIAIGAPLSLSKKDELFRKADIEIVRKNYRELPPNLLAINFL
jgi:predicted nuclease with RNAse H fold